jgi:Ca2+-binding EF-hand superfamily protein
MKLTRWLAAVLTVCGLGLAGNTAVAQDESEKPGDLFKTLDKNSDGKLTASEVSEDQKRFFDRLVRVGDTDENGELTRSEFDKATSPDADTPPAGQPDRRPGGGRPGQPGSNGARSPQDFFKRLDRNADGKVTLEEIPEAARSRMKPLFERIGKEEITLQDLQKLRPDSAGRRPEAKPGQGSRRPGDSDGKRPENPQSRRSSDSPRSGSGQAPAFFRELDQDGDGALSRRELERAAALLDKLDRNGNGKLEIIELFAGRGNGSSGDRPGGNSTGRPQRPGDKPSPEGRPKRPGGAGDRARDFQGFGKLDKNGDGFLSRDEAPGRLKENFDRIDKNGDGKISGEEVRALSTRSRD